MLAFTDDLLKAGLEGDPAAESLLGRATGRAFTSCNHSSSTPTQFHAFRGPLEALDAPCNEQQLDKSSTLFIDDTLQHIEGARLAGLQTFHLTNPGDLFQLFS